MRTLHWPSRWLCQWLSFCGVAGVRFGGPHARARRGRILWSLGAASCDESTSRAVKARSLANQSGRELLDLSRAATAELAVPPAATCLLRSRRSASRVPRGPAVPPATAPAPPSVSGPLGFHAPGRARLHGLMRVPAEASAAGTDRDPGGFREDFPSLSRRTRSIVSDFQRLVFGAPLCVRATRRNVGQSPC